MSLQLLPNEILQWKATINNLDKFNFKVKCHDATNATNATNATISLIGCFMTYCELDQIQSRSRDIYRDTEDVINIFHQAWTAYLGIYKQG